jgi:NAD(P)-dependent dehydrogenase (short-subunit alcohol dehydrogenase family)
MKKSVFVTGANGHLGQQVVDAFSANGYCVIGAVRKPQPAISTVEYAVVDLADEVAVSVAIDNVIQQHTRINAAALVAGGFEMGNVADTDYAAIAKMMDLNFKTAYACVRPLVQHMATNGGGTIILVASKSAVEPQHGPFALAYTLSKSLLVTLAEIVNAEWNKQQVVVHVLAPGTIDTQANREAMPTADYNTWVKAETLTKKMVELCDQPVTAGMQTVHRFY